jgi:hypothetical protein
MSMIPPIDAFRCFRASLRVTTVKVRRLITFAMLLEFCEL